MRANGFRAIIRKPLFISGQDQKKIEQQFFRTQVFDPPSEAVLDKSEATVYFSYPPGVQWFFVDHGRLLSSHHPKRIELLKSIESFFARMGQSVELSGIMNIFGANVSIFARSGIKK